MLHRNARLIIAEIEAGGGIDMEYVKEVAKEDGITERQVIAFWLRDHWPVSAYQSLNMADYFLDKERKGE